MTIHEYHFGEYRLAPAARELWHAGQLAALPPKSLDCLTYLVEHRERAVGRDELISAVWGRADVSDDVLAQTLLRARRAVGDTGNEQRAIRTVPRFGYRWVLPVDDVVVAPAPSLDSAQGQPTPTPAPATAPLPAAKRRARHATLALLAVLAACALVAGIFGVRSSRDRATATSSPVVAAERIVMVLPVDVRGGDRTAAWIRLGAMDYLAASLRGHADLKVLPSEQTLLLAGREIDPSDAGTLHRLELSTGARYIVAPQATSVDGGWAVVLDVYHDGGVRSYEARGDNPLDAASLALTRFAGALGIATETPRTGAATELRQRMDAALLAGDLAEAHHLVDTTPAALKDDPAVRVRTGQIAFRAGQLDVSSALLQPLADDASLAADTRAQAQMGLGAVAVRRGDFNAAEAAYSAAIATLAGAHADADLLGSAYSGRGVSHGARGQFDAALADFARARVEFERAGDRTGAATVEVNVALVESRHGRYDQAAAAFDRAIATFTRFDVRDNLAAALLGKAEVQLALLENAGALASSERAENLAAQLENPLLKRRVAAARASALIANGELTSAARVIGESVGAAELEFEMLRAALAFERGDGAQASARVAGVLDRVGDDTSVPPSTFVLVAADARRRGGDTATLERALRMLQANTAAVGDRDRAFALELGAAELAAARAAPDTAMHFDAALVAADQRGSPEAVARVAVAALAWRLQQADRGGLDSAATLVGRLVAWDERDYRCARAVAAFYRALGDRTTAAPAEAAQRRLAGERDPQLPL